MIEHGFCSEGVNNSKQTTRKQINETTADDKAKESGCLSVKGSCLLHTSTLLDNNNLQKFIKLYARC